jgi:hypothetical protein
MSLRLRVKIEKKSAVRLGLFIVLLSFLLSSVLSFPYVKSETSENTPNGLLTVAFLIIIIILSILVITENPLVEFLADNYKITILIIISLFILIYFIPRISLKSITGFFVVPKTTTNVTTTNLTETIPVVGAEKLTTEMTTTKTITTTTTSSTTTATSITITTTTGTTTTTSVTTTITGITTTTVSSMTINFDRILDCQKCGQHKAPPLIDVKMTITATVSSPMQNTYLIDYYPSEWTVIDSNQGMISVFNSSYNMIKWDIPSAQGSVSKWYIIKSPQRTLPPTKYYFFSEMKNQKSDLWDVIVSDPTKSENQYVNQYNCSASGVNCNETTVIISYTDGNQMMINYQKPVNFFDSTLKKWQAINSTIDNKGCDPLYNYCVVKGLYTVNFKTDPSTAETIKYFYNTSRIGDVPHKTGYVTYQLHSLNYRNDLDQLQQINITQPISGLPVDVSFVYPNVFGSGYNVSYTYLTDGLKEKLILREKNILPTPQSYIISGGNATLDLDFLIDYSGNVNIYIDGVLWDGKTTKTTSNRVDFKDSITGTLLFYLPKSFASDMNETNVSEQVLKYQFKKTGGKLYAVIKTPYSWLNASTRVYPVTIDPTTKIEYNTTIDYYSINNTLNDYYFNTTNAEQRTYDFKNYWTKNDVCLGLYFGNRWHEFCGIDFNWVWYNSTNFTTYMNLTGTAELKYAGYTIDARVEYYLGEDYPEVRGTVTLENVGNKDISDSYIKIKTHDINVNTTAENDTFRVNTTSFWEPWSGYKEYLLNDTSLSLLYTQNNLVSRKFAVFDNSTESWVELEWNDSYWRNGIRNDIDCNLSVEHHSEYNAPVELLLLTGSLSKNDVIFTNFKWADAVKQNFTEANETYNEILDWFKTLNLTKYVQGEEKIEGHNITIIVNDNGRVNVSIEHEIYNENVTKIGFFEDIAWKYNRFTFRKADGFDMTRYPENKTNTESIFRYFAAQELQLGPRTYSPGIVKSYSIPYLLIDNQNGSLEDYKLTPGTDFDIETVKKSRVKLSSIFDISLPYELKTEFNVIFDYTGKSHCIRFGVFRYHPLNISVTMPSNIDNYTLPTTLTLVSTTGPTLVAKRVFPVPETDEFIQEVKICSI